jgi:hypothetical protein
MKKWIVAAFAAMLALPAMAQEDALKDLPGYVSFGELSQVYGEPKVMINLGGSILRFVGAAAKNEPEVAGIMKNLKGVRINVYNIDGNPGAALEQVKSVKGMLTSGHWEPIVQVNEDGEQAQIFDKMVGDTMEGLTVMAVNADEAVFINSSGQLDPSPLSSVMDNFDIDIGDIEID